MLNFPRRRPGLLACCWSLSFAALAQSPAPANSARVPITRIFSGPDGETHAEEILAPMGAPRGGASFSTSVPAANILFMSRPGPVVEDWHTAPRKQYAITMSGRAEMEIGGGKRIPLPPGSVLLIEDSTGKGHRVHVLGSEPWVAAFIPVAAAAAGQSTAPANAQAPAK